MPFLEAGDLRLHYEETGSGAPLVLLPGLGMRAENWAPHLPLLAANRRVIALDVRGGAESDCPDGPYETREMAEDTVLALDSLGIERTDVLGLSMGGFVAQWLALKHPERIARMVLALTALRPTGRGCERLKLELRLRENPALHELHFRELFLWLFDDATFERAGAVDRFVEAALDRVGQESLAGIRGRVAACLAHDARSWASRITVPTLVIGGTEDLIYPPREARALATAIPGAKLELIEGAHALSGLAIRRFGEAVRRFLET